MLSVIQWVSKIPFDMIRQIATEFDLNPLLLDAMIMQESGGQECAMRYEPRWKYEWQTAEFSRMIGSSQATEIIGQKTSWGPMQVMGTVAREQGFDGWFPELCDFDLGTYYGAKVLSNKVGLYSDINDAISAYNMGTPKKNKDGKYINQEYVTRVREYWNQLEGV